MKARAGASVKLKLISTLAVAATAIFSTATVAWGGGGLAQKPGAAGCVSSTLSGCQKGKALKEAEEIAVSPDGKSVYVTSYLSSSISIFDRSRATGRLIQKRGRAGCISEDPVKGGCAHARALDEPQDVEVSPDGKNVYVVSFDSNSVAIFDRNPATGALTQKPGPAGCVSEAGPGDGCEQATKASLDYPDGLAISPDGASLYAASENSDSVAIFDRDPATGLLAQKPDRAGCIVDRGRRGGECARGKGINFPLGVEVSPDGKNVYVASQSSNGVAIFERNTATGELSQRHGAAACLSRAGEEGCGAAKGLGFSDDLGVSPDGRNLYVLSRRPGAVLIFDRRAGRRGAVASG